MKNNTLPSRNIIASDRSAERALQLSGRRTNSGDRLRMIKGSVIVKPQLGLQASSARRVCSRAKLRERQVSNTGEARLLYSGTGRRHRACSLVIEAASWLRKRPNETLRTARITKVLVAREVRFIEKRKQDP